MKKLLTLLFLACGLTTGLWASSTPGALSGLFTINASGDKVQFSKGNLQYVDENYQFAEHQYDYFGGNQYSNHVDMFANNGYSSPDGDTAWRILSQSEWSYLYTERSVTNTLSEGARYSKATIGGTYKGVIVFPDSYTHPNGTGFAGNCNNAAENYASTVSLEGWALMEAAGCVFLPAAGYNRDGNIKKVNDASTYDSSTANNSESRYTPGFYYNEINLGDWSYNTTCVPVRLVKDYQLQQDAEGNYLIGSAYDWKLFATLVQTTPAANAKMTADINLGDDQTMIGTGTQWSDYGETGILRFQGVFDGQGHTLTINYNATTESFTAPFRHIKKATIKNLRVAGTITTNHTIAAGIASSCAGNDDNSYIINCVSSVDIISNYVNSGHQIYDGARTAGIIGQIFHNAHINISDCIFNGSISGETQQVLWGGMVGLPDGPVTITNSLQIGSFDCSDVVTGNEGSGTFSTIWNKNINITNSYYLNALGAVQGTQATSAQLSDGTTATALQNNRAETVWVQDPLTNQPMLAVFAGKYTVPASGLGTFSAKAAFTLPDGLDAYYCKNYDSAEGTMAVVAINGVVPAETGVLLKGEPGETYTLTTSNETPATITDNALVAVTEQTTIQQTADINEVNYTNFGLSGGVFKKVNSAGGTVKANRAYLHIPTSALTPEASARGILLVWDEESTGVTVVNGSGLMVHDYYDLQGRRVVNPARGLYIVNGKKVFIK